MLVHIPGRLSAVQSMWVLTVSLATGARLERVLPRAFLEFRVMS